MSDQHQHDDAPGEPAAGGERFETVWDRTANGGVGGWVRRRITAGPTAVNPGAPPRPHHEPTAHLPAATPPARPGTPPPAPPDEQDTVDNPAAARGMPAGPPPPGWPVSTPPLVSTPPRVSPEPPAVPPPPLPRPPVPPNSSAPTADWYRQEPGAAHTPVHGVPGGHADHGVPPARDVPAAPDWYRGATPPAPGPLSPTPPGPSFERTLLFIVAAVVLVAAVGTLFALKPWAEDDKAPAAHGSPSVGSTAGSPSPSGEAAGAQPGAPSTPPPARQSTITTPPPASPTPDARTQAAALDTLLSRSGSSRQSVIDAVNNVGSCSSLAASRSALLDAAAQRDQLVTQLDSMRFDEAPELQAAAPTLRTAWTASARADRSFAAWAQSAADSGCPGTRALYDEGATISSEASTAKKSFVTTWNAVASRYGLTSRSELDL
ncbi:hypothetical protein [Embleya hyalina]|nr:hypothetical protein [Embleya hyalina]